jgi:transposase
MVVETRRAILTQWKEWTRSTPKRKKHTVTTAFIQQLLYRRGMRVSVRTLYEWLNRFNKLGVAGLIDHRKWNRNARPASSGHPQSARTCIKGRSTGV